MGFRYDFASTGMVCSHSLDDQPKADDFFMHAHEMMEIFCFLSGSAKYNVEGNSYPLEPYTILIMRMSETHMIQLDPTQPYERMSIHFVPQLISKVDQQETLLRPFNARAIGRLNKYDETCFSGKHYRSCINAILSQIDSEKAQSVLIFSHLLSLLAEISDAFDRRPDKADENLQNGIAVEIVDYVNGNLFSDLSLQSISHRFYLSCSQVNRIYKKATGSSLWDYIVLKRLMSARQMILGGTPSTKACTECGFHDYSAFYRAYKRQFQLAPKADRLLYEKNNNRI